MNMNSGLAIYLGFFVSYRRLTHEGGCLGVGAVSPRRVRAARVEGMAVPVGDLPPSMSRETDPPSFLVTFAGNGVSPERGSAALAGQTMVQQRAAPSAHLEAVSVSAWFGTHKVL